jgi:hypothetical protein
VRVPLILQLKPFSNEKAIVSFPDIDLFYIGYNGNQLHAIYGVKQHMNQGLARQETVGCYCILAARMAVQTAHGCIR